MKSAGEAGGLREIIGVHHMKLHVFDDNVMITGANLSDDYFTNRQDRCYVILGAKHLADFVSDLNDTISDVSFRLGVEGNLETTPKFPKPSDKKWKNTFTQLMKVLRYSHRT